MKKIVLTGGGTGGHIFPLATVVEYIKDNYQDEEIEFRYLGPKGSLEKEVMTNLGIQQRGVLSGKLRRYFSFAYIIDLIKMPLGFMQSLFYLLTYMPDAVFAKGGYASVPVVLAAWLYRIPIIIHESDAKPGMANEFLGNLATRVAISFERAKIHFPVSKTFVSGNPVSERVLNGSPEEAMKILGIKKVVKPVVFILGGSQGAELINRRILQTLKPLVKNYQIIHQTGAKNYKAVVQEAERQGFKIGHSDYYPVAFVGDEINHFYALADVVISRAGATTIAEISANEKLSILVPITKSANNHQRMNAFEIARIGGAIVLEENNFKESMILLRLKQLAYDEEVRAKIQAGVGKFHNPQATQIIAEELLRLAGE
jgi:UDP-N-acetylglucosamine--N-acetylmuramyl-(pentapeptide) pyrophosphoryl-undecaprenol N-acetylglucosamine transferase